MSPYTILDFTSALRQSRKGSEWKNKQNKIQNEENMVQKKANNQLPLFLWWSDFTAIHITNLWPADCTSNKNLQTLDFSTRREGQPHMHRTLLLICTWRHSGHVGGQEQKHFSPLGTKLYFHVNSLRKKFYCIDPQHGCKPRILTGEVEIQKLQNRKHTGCLKKWVPRLQHEINKKYAS